MDPQKTSWTLCISSCFKVKVFWVSAWSQCIMTASLDVFSLDEWSILKGKKSMYPFWVPFKLSPFFNHWDFERRGRVNCLCNVYAIGKWFDYAGTCHFVNSKPNNTHLKGKICFDPTFYRYSPFLCSKMIYYFVYCNKILHASIMKMKTTYLILHWKSVVNILFLAHITCSVRSQNTNFYQKHSKFFSITI